MSVTINFGGYFTQDTTVEEIYNIFCDNGKELYRLLQKDGFGPNKVTVNAALLDTAISFFAGIPESKPSDKIGLNTIMERAFACGYAGKVRAWSQNVLNGCFGSSRKYANHPDIDNWREQVRALHKEIYDNRTVYTAGKVYEMIESHPLWENSYEGDNGITYSMKDARSELLSFVRDPANYTPPAQRRGKYKKTGTERPLENQSTDLPSDPLLNTLVKLIQNGQNQIVLTGAPGAGKTFTAGEVAKWFCGENGTFGRVKTVQFHPSYDYTDFVEGISPVEVTRTREDNSSHTEMHFRRTDGSFMRFCREVALNNELAARAVADPDAQEEDNLTKDDLYFFIIDEINRADISKVFGELMFALEIGNRKRVVTQYSKLETYFTEDEAKLDPYFRDCFNVPDDPGFFVPKNVVIIGTMNDIDRSVESIDFAMRRRFVWLEVKVTKELLASAFQSGNFGDLVKKKAKKLAKRVVDFNEVLHDPQKYNLSEACQLSSDYDIAQGQFSGVKGRDFDDNINLLMEWVWDYRVSQLIREYMRGRIDDAKTLEKTLNTLRDIWLNEAPESDPDDEKDEKGSA